MKYRNPLWTLKALAVVVLLAAPASAMVPWTDGVIGKEPPQTDVTNGVVTSAEYPQCLVDVATNNVVPDLDLKVSDDVEACSGLFVSVGLPDPDINTAIIDGVAAGAHTQNEVKCRRDDMRAPADVHCEYDFGGERRVKALTIYYCQPSCGSLATSGSIHNYPTSNRANPVYWYYDYVGGTPMRVACSEGKGRDWRLTGLQGTISRDESPTSSDGKPCFTGDAKGLWNIGATFA